MGLDETEVLYCNFATQPDKMNHEKIGVLLMNLGSPDSTDVKDVKKYLLEFLMDERVIDYPYLQRSLLVKGIIVPFRAKKSASAYKSIWTDKGSPLINTTRELQQALEIQTGLPVEICMRYRNPTPESAFERLLEKDPDIKKVIAIPMYPHYAMSSYETAVEQVKQSHQQGNYPFDLEIVQAYYKHPAYLKALAETIRPYLNSDYDHILFSYHGIPKRHIRKSDITKTHCLSRENCCEVDSAAHEFCYRHQCFTTTRLITEMLGIPREKFSNSFQSRLGGGWLEPFTDKRLKALPGEGKKKLLILCPAFVSDCLETLEEIAEEGKHTFMEAGGESFHMIPCLNVSPLWVSALETFIQEQSKVQV